MSSHVAFIPARGGSKGIPKKNIKLFCGKPLLYWSILHAQMTPEISDVYVSSDSEEILSLARGYGAKTIVRPNELSGDSATTESAVLHFLDELKQQPNTVVLLQATSPLRFPDDISKAIRLMVEKNWDSLFSGAYLEDFLIWRQQKEGLVPLNYDYKNRGKRQDRIPEYCENGSIYIFKPSVIQETNNRLRAPFGVFLQEFWQCFELDSPDEWSFLEVLFQHYLNDRYKEKEN